MFDSSFFVALSFLIFVGLVIYMGLPRMIISVLDKRSKDIKEELDEARNLREEAQKILAKEKKNLDKAEEDSKNLIKKAKQQVDEMTKKAEEALKNNPDTKILAFVHAETSTGALSDPESLTKLAHDYDCLSIVDTVTGLAGVPLKVDEWDIDAIYSGTQKCLSASPGLSPISFSEAAQEKIKNRSSKVKSWFLDLNLIMSYWEGEGGRSYHHTAPINALYGLHEALLILKEIGIENSWKKHMDNHLILREGLQDLGISYLVDEDDRLPQLNSIFIPEGVDDLASRQKLLNDFNLEIGAGLGVLAGKIWRIGLMGSSSNKSNIDHCLESLKQVI